MPLFWGIAALFVAVATVLVLFPLLRRSRQVEHAGRRAINIAIYRDQLQELERDRSDGAIGEAQYAAAKLEIETRLAQDALHEADPVQVGKGGKPLGYILGLTIPAAAFGLYMLSGNPDAILQASQAQSSPLGGHDVAAMVQALEEKVQANPDDAGQMLTLAKTYSAIDRWSDALRTFERLVKMAPRHAAALSGYAEALAVAAGRELRGKPMELIYQALEIDPNDEKALELAGINAYQEGNFTQAAFYWKQLLKQLPADSPYAQDLAGAIKEARGKAEAGFGDKLDKLVPDDPRIAAVSISGRVELADELRGKMPPDAVMYLFARSLDGRGPPLAALKGNVKDLPLTFDLDDTMAMDPNNRLSSHKEVTLVARISKSGQAAAASGDLEGTLSPVKLGSKDLRLVIDTVKQ